MQCPNDGQTLAMTTREGIEIDYCPICRGVWLDRGELDKIIERTAAVSVPSAAPAPAIPYAGAPQRDRPTAPEPRYDNVPRDGDRKYRHDDDDSRRYGPGEYGSHGQRKRKSFLGDLFDFD